MSRIRFSFTSRNLKIFTVTSNTFDLNLGIQAPVNWSDLNWEYLKINLWPVRWNVWVQMPRKCFSKLHTEHCGDKFVWFHIFIKLAWEKCRRASREFTRRPTATRWELKGNLIKNVQKPYFSQLLGPPAQSSQNRPEQQSEPSQLDAHKSTKPSEERKQMWRSFRPLIINVKSYHLKAAGYTSNNLQKKKKWYKNIKDWRWWHNSNIWTYCLREGIKRACAVKTSRFRTVFKT